MSLILLNKLLAIFCTVGLGWVAGRLRWLGEPAGGIDPARLLGNVAFYIFVPALLFQPRHRSFAGAGQETGNATYTNIAHSRGPCPSTSRTTPPTSMACTAPRTHALTQQ